jgi:trk system potassium uptake protein TrkH
MVETPSARRVVRRRRDIAQLILDVLLAVASVFAVAALLLEYGFYVSPVPLGILRGIEAFVIGLFVLDRFARLSFAPRKKLYLRQNAVDFGLMIVALVVLAISWRTAVSFGAIYVLITQAYILLALILRGVGLNLRFADSGIHPSWLLIGSFIFLIAAGTGMLMLPRAVRPEFHASWHLIDSFFTATSATCVTGLVVRNTGEHFTVFGQTVILLLIQAGGLGIMMFGTVLGLLIGKNLSIRQSETMGQIVGAEGIGRLGRVAVFVMVATFVLETIGAIMFYPMFAAARDTFGQPLSVPMAVWHAVFHSVSAFCNAGFALYDRSMMAGLGEAWGPIGPLRDNWQVMGVMAPLIVLGGLGFPVLEDTARWGINRLQRLWRQVHQRRAIMPDLPQKHRLKLHTRIVLTASIVLILLGAALLLALESPRNDAPRIGAHRESIASGDWTTMSTVKRVRGAVFQSITARTAGFNTIDMSELSNAGKLWMCLLMTIGGSPASTAGGMKTVIVGVLLIVAWCQLVPHRNVEAFKRTIPRMIIDRAVTIAGLYLGLLLSVTLLLCVAQGPGFAFVDLLFEACSACGTVGLSTGVTGELSLMGKLVIIGGMFAGRLGPLTLLAALTTHLRPVDYSYPSEELIIG